eukprot:scaffold235082_cov17-Tisochrysis_lutea.AAC.1
MVDLWPVTLAGETCSTSSRKGGFLPVVLEGVSITKLKASEKQAAWLAGLLGLLGCASQL